MIAIRQGTLDSGRCWAGYRAVYTGRGTKLTDVFLLVIRSLDAPEVDKVLAVGALDL